MTEYPRHTSATRIDVDKFSWPSVIFAHIVPALNRLSDYPVVSRLPRKSRDQSLTMRNAT